LRFPSTWMSILLRIFGLPALEYRSRFIAEKFCDRSLCVMRFDEDAGVSADKTRNRHPPIAAAFVSLHGPEGNPIEFPYRTLLRMTGKMSWAHCRWPVFSGQSLAAFEVIAEVSQFKRLTVGDFVAVKASKNHVLQLTSTTGMQQVQYQSIGSNRISQSSTGF